MIKKQPGCIFNLLSVLSRLQAMKYENHPVYDSKSLSCCEFPSTDARVQPLKII